MKKNISKLPKKKTFNLFGVKIKIVYQDNSVDEKGNWLYGYTKYLADLTEIYLSTKDKDGKKLTEDSILRTLRHELFHTILSRGMYFDECNNEPMIEWLALCTDELNKQGLSI